MGVTGSLSKIGAVFFAAVIFAEVAPSKSAYAQTRNVGNFGRSAGPFLGRPGFARGLPFGFHGGFGRQNFGTNIVVVPSAGLAAPDYGVPPPDYGVPPAPYGVSPLGYDSLRCYLHRHVDTPNGPVLQPVYVC